MVEPLWKKSDNFLKVKHNIQSYGWVPKEMKIYIHTKTCKPMFTAALLEIAKIR